MWMLLLLLLEGWWI